MTAFPFPAVGCSWRKPGITPTTDKLIAVVFLSKKFQRWLDDATSKPKDEMESRLFLNVIVGKGSAVFELFTGKDKPLLIWRNTFFVLDLRFDIFDGVRGLDLEGDGLTGQGFDEDLHLFDYL